MQAIRIKYLHPDSELQNFASQVMEMLDADASVDAHKLVCSQISMYFPPLYYSSCSNFNSKFYYALLLSLAYESKVNI